MKIEVDQSGKVESTRRATVLAFSNEHRYSILISAQVKKRCHEYLKERKCLPKTRHLRLFAVTFILLLKDYVNQLDSIVIDTEYKGSERNLKLAISNAFKKVDLKFDLDRIMFAPIGKKSNAHILAVEVLRKRRDPNRRITFEEIKSLL